MGISKRRMPTRTLLPRTALCRGIRRLYANWFTFFHRLHFDALDILISGHRAGPTGCRCAYLVELAHPARAERALGIAGDHCQIGASRLIGSAALSVRSANVDEARRLGIT